MLHSIEQPVPRSGERYFKKMTLMSVTEKMTRYGWLVDRLRISEHRRVALDRVERFTSTWCQMSGMSRESLGPAGAGATAAVKAYFFDELGAPVVSRKKGKRGPGSEQLNMPTLIDWATTDRKASWAAPAAALYAIRKNRKLVDFCDTYIQFSKDDGRIHFAYNPLGTQTGRWTSATKRRDTLYDRDGTARRKKFSCNAQQIPKRDVFFDFGSGNEPLAAGLRDCFLADPGCVLLRADYDQLELRLIAYIYGVRKLMDALIENTDIHLLTASSLFRELGVTVESDKRDSTVYNCREAAKTCAYAFAYQVVRPNKVGRYPTAFKTLKARFPNLREEQMPILVSRFFELYPEIRSGQLDVVNQVDSTGYQELKINGRRLYYPATDKGYNGAANFPNQGTGGALADDAVVELDPQLDWEGGCQIRGQVHDEVIAHAPLDRACEVKVMLERAMSRPAQIGAVFAGIPAEADPGFDWGHCMKWNDFWADAPYDVRSYA